MLVGEARVLATMAAVARMVEMSMVVEVQETRRLIALLFVEES